MTLVSRCAAQAPVKGTSPMQPSSEQVRSAAARSSSRGSLREIAEEPAESPTAAAAHEEMKEEDKVYVAVVKDMKEGKANFLWVLQNTSKDMKIIVVHVHRPANKIPTALGWFPANQLKAEEVAAYRSIERENMHKSLDEYISMCAQVKVRKAEKLVIEKDDVGKGLVELIPLHGITNLVMGAAADKNFSRRMKAPRSKTALTVQHRADPSCKIRFVCKGNLISTRDACLDRSVIAQSTTASPSSITSPSEMPRSRSLPQAQGELPKFSSLADITQDVFARRSRSASYAPYPDLRMATLSSEGLARSSTSGSRESSVIDPCDVASRASDPSAFDEVHRNMASLSIISKDADREDGALIPQSMHEPEGDHQSQSPQHDREDLGVNDVMYERLQAALSEAENSKCEAYEEFYKRRKAEKDLNEAMRKAKLSETLCTKEVKQRKEIEETLAKEKMELLALKKQRDEVYEELQKACQKMAALELWISDSDKILKDLKGKISEANSHLDLIQQENEVLRRERDDAIRENEELQQNKEDATTSIHGAEKFFLSELEQATENFHEASKIGEGGYGCVYKGFLRHTTVAVKRLSPQGMQGQAEFQRETDVLSRVRHPNLVTLIGVCPEAWALVYEFLPNGSLEDQLTCKDNTLPLPWQARTRIAAEICSALIFLHSRRPLSVVHGDLKPANILLDANLVSKLGDFGICRVLDQSNSTTLYHCTRQPKGTFAYMDPELLSSGEITTKSDVYSFGVIMLRLLTGRPAFGLIKVVQEALSMNSLDKILDVSAGDWPYVQAEKFAKLGLKCCEMNRRNRPDAKEAWKMLEPLTKVVSFAKSSPSSFTLATKDGSEIPSYFLCPILKELMRDPQIAADGFTYEAEAIKAWLDSDRDTSPMTNLKLYNRKLIPNHALRSAIQGWLQQQT